MTAMFVALSTYLKPLEDVNASREHHLKWIAGQFDSGHLLVSGRRNPAVGGVIVGRAASLEAFHALLADDPFVRAGLAHYEVVEFEPTAAALETSAFATFIGTSA
jgi:uncharacterized protein YciI